MRDKRTFFQHVWHDTETKCGAHVSFWRPTTEQHTLTRTHRHIGKHTERERYTHTALGYASWARSHTDSNMWLGSLSLSTLTRAFSAYICSCVRVVESCVQSQSRSLTLPALTQCVVFVCVCVELFVQSPLRCLLSLSLGRITLIKVYLRDYTKWMELRINFQGMSFRFGIIPCMCVSVCLYVCVCANSLRYNGFRFALPSPSPWGLCYKNTPEFIMPKRVIRQRRT